VQARNPSAAARQMIQFASVTARAVRPFFVYELISTTTVLSIF